MSAELVFLHIPKTAGTSVQFALRHYYGDDEVFWFGVDGPAAPRLFPRKLIGDRHLVGGHKPLHFYPARLDPLYCAVVRDPVARAISLFAYYARPELAGAEKDQQVRNRHLQELRGKGLDPESMLSSIRHCRAFRREITNTQCKYLSRGRHTFANVIKTLGGLDVLVGTVERFDEFYRCLGELLNWTPQAPALHNRSQGNYAANYLQDDELIALVRELNGEDEKLLQYIQGEQRGLWMNIREPQRRRARLSSLPLKPWLRGASWEQSGAQVWPEASVPDLPWPAASLLVVDEPALVYLPIPGPSDSWVQRVMLQLSGVANKQAIVELGMGRVLQRFNTGLLLRDRGLVQCQQLLADSRYCKFAVINEPLARLLDVYSEYFVARRLELATWPRLYALVGRAQGCDQPDLDAGISFRQFVNAVVSVPAGQAHILWRPQYLYLEGAVACDTLYTPGTLVHWYNTLLSCAAAATLADLPPPAGDEVCPQHTVSTGTYADTPAGQLPQAGVAWRKELLDAGLLEQIRLYYRRDFELYASARTGEVIKK